MKKLRIAGTALIIISGALFILGMMTNWFVPVSGEVVESMVFNRYTGGSGASHKQPLMLHTDVTKRYESWVYIKYRYEIESQEFESSFIGFYLPLLSDIKPIDGEFIQVYVSSLFPNISVLKKGPDLRLVLVLVMLGGGLLYIKHWLKKSINKNAHNK